MVQEHLLLGDPVIKGNLSSCPRGLGNRLKIYYIKMCVSSNRTLDKCCQGFCKRFSCFWERFFINALNLYFFFNIGFINLRKISPNSRGPNLFQSRNSRIALINIIMYPYILGNKQGVHLETFTRFTPHVLANRATQHGQFWPICQKLP